MTQTTVPAAEAVELSVVRVKMGDERPAPQPDPLGRELIGFAEGLSPAELWERGRGVWKAKVTALAEADLVILAVAGRVVMVGTVDGVTFHDDRVAVSGRPLPAHPLIGGPDPLHNDSRNPLTYGQVRTLPASAFPDRGGQPRAHDEVWADAVRVLTEAARLRRPAYRQTPSGGGWEPHPTATEPADWAEFVTQALVAAAANVGGIETALAGRSGSWEADGVRRLIAGTIGEDEQLLLEHRTEPLIIVVDVDQILGDRTDLPREYDDDLAEIDRQRDADDASSRAAFDESAYLWHYDRDSDGEWIPRDPAAPAWSWDAWRAELAASEFDPELIDRVEESLRTGVGLFTGQEGEVTSAYLPKSPEAAAELRRLEAEDEARQAFYEELEERLEQQRLREWSEYGEALKTHIEAAIRTDVPGLTVPAAVVIAGAGGPTRPAGLRGPDWPDWTVQDRLIDSAVTAVTSPADLPGTPLERLQNHTTQQEPQRENGER